MNNLAQLSDAELLHATRVHLERSHEMDAELLLLLGEIEERRLYAERAFSSMFDFCTRELNFSEDVACNRIALAKLARRLPRVLDFVRDGRIHLSGLGLLAKHLTEENVETVLAAAAGKSKRSIEELVARLAPQPSVSASIRKLPERPSPAPMVEEAPPALPLVVAAAPMPLPPPIDRKPEVKPLSAEGYLVKLTVSRELKEKLERAQELMRHRGEGDLATVIERAVDLLIEDVMKERFGVGRKSRGTAANAEQREEVSRHIPDPIKREVYERDGGQCTFVSADGRRCDERGGLEYEHIEGFARTAQHTVEGITLHCRTHNQLAADRLYGRGFMDSKRGRIRTGTDNQGELL
jgi:hypothetical protein